MLIRELSPGERPMERLARLGAQVLRDAELLAVILGGQTAFEAAETALRDGLEKLQKQARNPLLSEIRQARILALLEISRRLELLHATPERVVLRAYDIAPHLVARYSREPQEHLGVVLFDARLRFMAERVVYIGEHDHVFGSPRWLLKDAIVEDARAIILFHNHPSGDPGPSPEDTAFTGNFKHTCDLMNIELHDHIIVGRNNYYSYRAKRRL